MPNALLCGRQMAAIVLDKNERTLRRWCEDGVLAVTSIDARGRTMFDIEAILGLCGDLRHADTGLAELILAADGGSAEAQNDLGIVLLQAGQQLSALSLFKLAAGQDYPDAMHFLYRCHQSGTGTHRNEALAMMWLSKAVVYGHPLAQAQLTAMHNLAEQACQR